MKKFLKNLSITLLMFVCGVFLFQGSSVFAAAPAGVIDNVSGTFLYGTGTISLSSLENNGIAFGGIYDIVMSGVSVIAGSPLILSTPDTTGSLVLNPSYFSTYGYYTLSLSGATNGPGPGQSGNITNKSFYIGMMDYVSLYTGISDTLSGQGIKNNFSDVTYANVTSFPNLYFEYVTGGVAKGKISFSNNLDLTNSGTITFLQNLPTYLDMKDGQINFTVGTSVFKNYGAVVTMNFDTGANFVTSYSSHPELIQVQSDTGYIYNSASVLSGIVGACNASGCSIVFDTTHFTSFGTKPILTSVNIQSSAGTGAWSGDVVYLTFTGSEALSGVSVTIAGQTANLVGGGTSWYATGLLITGGTVMSQIPFQINFSDYFGNAGLATTGTTDASYVNYWTISNDATLSNLTISTGILSPVFNTNVTGYTVNFPYSRTGTLTATGTKNNSYATVTGNNSLSLATAGSTGNIVLTVIAQDGTTSGTYTVNVTRTAASTDANLSNLTLNTGTLSPSFSSGTTGYTVNFPYSWTGTLTATPTKSSSFATTTGNTSLVLSTKGSTGTIAITVIAEDSTNKTYNVVVTRTAASTDITLSNLTANTGIVYGYTGLEVPYAFSGTVTITPTATNAYATVTGNYTTTLVLGQTGTLNVTVVAEDGVTSGNYNVNIFRTAASTNATLSNLTLSTGTLSPTFSSGTANYTVNFPYLWTGTITATPTKSSSFATTTGNTSLSLTTSGSTGTIAITVIAQDGTTSGTYTVTVTRTPLSSDANLSNLTLSTGTLSPTFSSGTISYTVNLPNGWTGTLTATPTKSYVGATTTGNTSVSLSTAGITGTIAITVIAEDGTNKTYSVTVTRSAPSSDANLINLTLSTGTLSGAFNSGTTSYTVQLAYLWTGTLTATPTKSNIYATTTGNTSLSLTSSGSTGSITITVIAENLSTKSYTVTVTRGAAPDTTAPVITLNGSNPMSVVISTSYTEPGATWTDNIDGAGTVSIINGSVNTGVLGAYTITYTKVDVAGNTGSTTRTVNVVSAGGGGGGASSKDNCPNGDYTASQYDLACGTAPIGTGSTGSTVTGTNLSGTTTTGTIITTTSGSQNTETNNNTKYSDELFKAYKYAYSIGITTMPSIDQANLTGRLTRIHMAKMMVNYALKVQGKTINTGVNCNFTDINGQSAELQQYAILACQLGIMGLDANGNPKDTFNPNGVVTRAEFGTVLSRILFGDKYNGGVPYYINHLQILNSLSIISNTDPRLLELRGYVMLMLMRAEK